MPRRFDFRRLPPIVTALLSQALAFATVAFGLRHAGFEFPPAAAGAIGLLAAGLSALAGQPYWWWLIQAFFPVLALAASAADISPHLYLGAFGLLLLVYWNTYRTRVPLYLSGPEVWRALVHLLPARGDFCFVDLGSGLGGVLAHLAEARPDGWYYGVESAPLPFIYSRLRLKLKGRRRCRIAWGNFRQCHLGNYDIAFAFLSPEPMADLWRKARAEMRPGTLFVSCMFTVPGQTPTRTIPLNRSALLVWQM